MLRDGQGIGSIALLRKPPKAFSVQQIALLTTFAEVLRAISSSVADAQPVFEKILDSCQALFGVDQMAITLVHDDGQVHAGAWRDEVMQESVKLLPTPVEKSATGQAILARRAVHIPDAAGTAATIHPVMHAVGERLGNFSALFAPLLLGGRGIGAIALFRMPGKPFSAKEIVLLTTFAEQAVIAIENARLFRETREALERQTATAEILRVISESSTDVQPAFDAIAERAMALCGAQGSLAISRESDSRALATYGAKTMNNAMSYRSYTASMTFDADDKIIVGRVLDLDDIIAFHGESVSDFETAFHAVIDAYIATCEKLGSAPEKPASGKLMLRVSPAVHAAALKAAARSGTSLNKWAEQALSAASRSHKGNPSAGASGEPV